MAEYEKLKKLDEESAKKMTEGPGPADECICSKLAGPEPPTVMQSMRASMRKAKRALSAKIPGGKTHISTAALKSTKEPMKNRGKCGKCSCDNEKIIMKHSVANIKISSPDIESVCPCPTPKCMPDKDKYHAIDVTLERVEILQRINYKNTPKLNEENDKNGSVASPAERTASETAQPSIQASRSFG